MTKTELATYLAALHSLMQVIDPTPEWLAAEYNAHWDLFKAKVEDTENARY